MPPLFRVFSPDLCPKHKTCLPNFLLSICNLKSICQNWIHHIPPPHQTCSLKHSCVPFLCKQHHLSPSCSCKKFRSHPWFFSSPLLFRSSELVNFITLIGLKSNLLCPFSLLPHWCRQQVWITWIGIKRSFPPPPAPTQFQAQRLA